YLGQIFRWTFGRLPFSLGDGLYAGCIIGLLILFIRFIVHRFKDGFNLTTLGRSLKKGVSIGLFVYVLFKLSWGLNYNRVGIRSPLKLEVPEHYSTGELQALTRDMLYKTNASRKQLGDSLPKVEDARIFELARNAYRKAEPQFPFLRYRIPS